MSLKFRNAIFSPVSLVTAEQQKLFIAAKAFELRSRDQKLAGKSSVWETWANSTVKFPPPSEIRLNWRQKLSEPRFAAKAFELRSRDQKLAGKSSVWETWANSAVKLPPPSEIRLNWHQKLSEPRFAAKAFELRSRDQKLAGKVFCLGDLGEFSCKIASF